MCAIWGVGAGAGVDTGVPQVVLALAGLQVAFWVAGSEAAQTKASPGDWAGAGAGTGAGVVGSDM